VKHTGHLFLAGIVIFHSTAIHAAPPTTQPEIRRGVPMSGGPGQRSRYFLEHLAAAAEPTGKADPLRLPQYLQVIKHELVADSRLIAFTPSAQMHGDMVLLGGYAESAELKTTTQRVFQLIGFLKIDNQMQVLPDAALGGQAQALVTAPKTFLYDQPAAPHESLSQAIIGDPIFLLRKEGDFYLCHAGDGYVGYIAASALRPIDAETFAHYLQGPRATITKDFHSGALYLPIGAHLRVAAEESLELPDGAKLQVPKENVASSSPDADERIGKIITAAKQMLGTPYVWGGRTTQGVDCSGLTGAAFQAAGVVLPRDADQQALCGTLVATSSCRNALAAGDLLFFISNRGQIHHVALYLGSDQFLEATTPVAKISSLNPKDANYSEKRDRSFAYAKRVLQ